MVNSNLKFSILGGGYFGVKFGHLKSEVLHWGGLSEIPERGFLENLDTNLLFEVNCTETCLCITDSLSHTAYVETNEGIIHQVDFHIIAYDNGKPVALIFFRP